jgi:2',3'-cyclic-nucleotide 2'-phosphodiesterase/3'-nucleotidase
VLLGGHSYTPIADARMNGVLYSQAGYHGIWLGRVDLTYDTVSKCVVRKNGSLEVMNGDVPFHAGLLARWKNDLDSAKAKLDEVIGYIPDALTTTPDARGQSPAQQLISQAIAEGTGAELVLHGSLGDETVEPGPFTYRDVWRLVPYENTIGVLSLTPSEVRDILVENHARSLSAHSLGPYGFTFALGDSANSSQRIGALRDLQGEALQGRRRYAVAMNSYVLASGGNRNQVVRQLADQPESRLQMLDTDTRSLVVSFIKKKMKAPLAEPALNQ